MIAPTSTPLSASGPPHLDPSLTSDETWPSSSPTMPNGGNGLGIFVQQHDVDPTLIYSDQTEIGYSRPNMYVQAEKYNSYTTLFRSPIKFSPFTDKNVITEFPPLSAQEMYSGSRRRKRTCTESTRRSGVSLPSSPISVVQFSVSDSGQAVIEERRVSFSEYQRVASYRERVASASSTLSTVSSSSSISCLNDSSDFDGSVSEAETEICDTMAMPSMCYSDARVAFAKVIRRQQIQLEMYHEEALQSGVSSSNSLAPAFTGNLRKQKKSSKKRRRRTKLKAHRHEQLQQQQSQQIHNFIDSFYSSTQQQYLAAAVPLGTTFKSTSDEVQEPAPKRKRGRPPKKRIPSPPIYHKQVTPNDATRCVCGTLEWYGDPMVQCDNCAYWLHMSCVSLDPRTKLPGAWYCPFCTGQIPKL
ncbi:hypothetical protein V1511DRAFT_456675 [Dipodascopsis uninucleata]